MDNLFLVMGRVCVWLLFFFLNRLKIYLVPLSFNYNVSEVQQQYVKTT